MTDEEKAIATRIAEASFPIFLAREINAGEAGKVASENSWVVAEMFIKARRQYMALQETKEIISADPRHLTQQEKGLIASNKKTQAIKEIGLRTGCSLVEATDAAVAYYQRLETDTNSEVPF
jgi:ribosomal protein L7/L12